MALFLSDSDIDRALTIELLLPEINEMFRQQGLGHVSVLERQRLRVRDGHLALIGGANHYQDMMGVKFNARREARASIYVILFDITTGQLVAIAQGKRLGELRTGAASGVAAMHLARRGAVSVGMLGTGTQSRTQLEALCNVRSVTDVAVYSPNPDHRRAFADEMSRRLTLPVTAVDSPKAAAIGRSIIVCITSAVQPVLDGEWLDPGTLVIAPGNTRWDAEEVDQATIRRSSRVIVDTNKGVRSESGELMRAVEQDNLRWEEVAELGDVVGGRATGRSNDDEIILYKPIGIGPLDVATAHLAYQRATTLGIGRSLEL